MKRKVVILIGIFALLIGINMQVTALNTNKDIKSSNNIKIEAEPPLDQWMPDKNLQKALTKVLGLSDVSELTQESLSKFSGFVDVPNSNIKDIMGLQYATSTPRIDINQNQISDLSPLSELKNLNALWANRNRISDLSPLSRLTNLQNLDIGSNQFSDLRPLSGLHNLQYLYLHDNQISDLSPVSRLTNLQIMGITSNKISDLKPLSGMENLSDLSISGNQISDLSPLSRLTNLQKLSIASNQISDLSPLSGLKKLDRLSASYNQISDLSPVSRLTNLQSLGVGNNKISDLSPLSGLEKLETLGVYNNHISDLSPLSGLTELASLRADKQSITNKALIGYVGYETGQKNNIINVDNSKLDLIPSSSEGVYDKAAKTINWIYADTGAKNAISTFKIKSNNDLVFSGKIIQPIKVKVDLTSIKVKDSEIHVNDVWKAKDNFVSATNQDGKAIGIEGIKVEGRVNTSRAGIYKVTYTVLNHAGVKISKEASIKAKENAHDDNKHPSDKDRLPKTGYDISVIGYLLGIAGILGAGSLYLNRKQ